MAQLNTIALRDALIDRVTDFALDDHFVRDEILASALRKLWSGRPETGGLGSDLWVEGAFPSTSAPGTMADLVTRGLVSEGLSDQLEKTGVFPRSITPYSHQWESIEATAVQNSEGGERPGIVVTAGTGAGKTESFLIPLLNDLWDSPGKQGEGISALILYPMNALVNDQVGRLDKWLKDQERVSFFHFTSETPENAKVANDRGLRPATAARFRTRQQARGREDRKGNSLPGGGGPNPDILVTNYSMLEYMLCRPQDGVFFGKNLRVVVLDEAHVYSGNLAAEITLLLRRVLMRCGRRPEEVLFIATSATIGGGVDELKPFAAKLFSKPESLVKVIAGRPARPDLEAEPAQLPLPMEMAETIRTADFPDGETLSIGEEGTQFRSANETVWVRWCNLLAILVPQTVLAEATAKDAGLCHVGPLLKRTLSHSPILAALQEILWNGGHPGRTPLRELAARLFSDSDESSIESTRRLLQMGAIARQKPSDLPLIPNRMHYLMRGPEGIQMAFGKVSHEGMVDLGGGRLVHSTGADPVALGSGAAHPLTLFRCNESGWWGVAGKQNNGVLDPIPLSTVLYGEDDVPDADAEVPGVQSASQTKFFSLEEVVGRPMIYFDPLSGAYSGSGPVALWEVAECPLSGAAFSPDTVGWFAARARLQLSVVAETALAAMPEYPDQDRVWKPARGRRLLVFSDSRAEAARLGPRLTRQHEVQVFRAAVVDRLQQVNLAGSDEEVAELRQEIVDLQSSLEKATPARQLILERRIEQAEGDLRQLGEGGSVTDWVKVLKESEIVCELYDAEGAKRHQPGAENTHDIWSRNASQIRDSLASLLGRELARRPAWPSPSLETLGLVEVTYPGIKSIAAPNEILGILPGAVASALENLWSDYLAALLDAVRNQGAVTLGSEERDRDYQYGNGFLGKSFGADQGYRRKMIPLIGIDFDGPQASRRNRFTRNVVIALGVTEGQATEVARAVMEAAFRALCDAAKSGECSWLQVDSDAPTDGGGVVASLQIRFQHLGLRRPSILYQCGLTRQVWPRSVAGFFPGSAGASLVAITHEAVDLDPRLGRRRRELREWQGFKLGLWAEEHSAQLSPEENARLQNLFREGMRNILSSTTTLELGIDIGGLSAVLLGNLPPGKANYLQRAGRAGRRADGTSAVLGFARPSAYEREVFLNFRSYLDRDLRRPTVFLDRAPLVKRHAHAWLLGEFFRNHFLQSQNAGAMDAYGRMGSFTGQLAPDFWKAGQPKPVPVQAATNPLSGQFLDFLERAQRSPVSDYPAALKNLWRGCPNVDAGEGHWPENIQSIRREFAKSIANWSNLYEELLRTWDSVPANAGAGGAEGHLRAQANAIFFQIKTLHRLTVIEALADSRYLPRYGFPIGLSRLRVQVADDRNPKRTREEDQFRLQRDGMMAMREYAPGSQLLVGGRIVTSRGLLKHWTGAVMQNEAWGLRGRFKRSGDGYFDYSLTADPPKAPPSVAPGQQIKEGSFLLPKHGFTTAAWDPPRFGSDFERVGRLEIYTLAFENPDACDLPQMGFGGISGCVATYRNAGELFLMNSGAKDHGFAICQKCGFAESEFRSGGTGRLNLPGRFEWHAPLNAANGKLRCWGDGEAPGWRNHHLAATQTTNLLKIDFGGVGQVMDRELLYTLGQALRLTAAQALELDEREIGLIDPKADSVTGQYRFLILYDSLAGGSGHLAELSHPDHAHRTREWLEAANCLLTVEGDMPDSVRHREGIRRLLTSNCDDSLLNPQGALEFLSLAMQGVENQNPQGNLAQALPDGAWTIERLGTETPPEEFDLFCSAGEITGLEGGTHRFKLVQASPGEGFPQTNSVVVVRFPGEPNDLAIGVWLYGRTNDPSRPHKVRLRRLQNSVSRELNDDEFSKLLILAAKL